jgi:hypothetical protein
MYIYIHSQGGGGYGAAKGKADEAPDTDRRDPQGAGQFGFSVGLVQYIGTHTQTQTRTDKHTKCKRTLTLKATPSTLSRTQLQLIETRKESTRDLN